MYEMINKKMKSVSIFVGSNKCNGNCAHCAGKIHRQFAPDKDGIVDLDLIKKILVDCYNKGARSLSVSSSGEPTLSPISVTKVLELINKLKNEEAIFFSKINLYSNGILIGNDENFSKKYLSLWKKLGLTAVYITVHNVNEKKNAQIYGISSYPPLKIILKRIHKAGLKARANIVLSKNNVHFLEDFPKMIEDLENLGFDKISACSIRNEMDILDITLAPQEKELDEMRKWIEVNNKKNVVLHREKDQLLYKKNEKLTLFPDGTLSNTWCNN